MLVMERATSPAQPLHLIVLRQLGEVQAGVTLAHADKAPAAHKAAELSLWVQLVPEGPTGGGGVQVSGGGKPYIEQQQLRSFINSVSSSSINDSPIPTMIKHTQKASHPNLAPLAQHQHRRPIG